MISLACSYIYRFIYKLARNRGKTDMRTPVIFNKVVFFLPCMGPGLFSVTFICESSLFQFSRVRGGGEGGGPELIVYLKNRVGSMFVDYVQPILSNPSTN